MSNPYQTPRTLQISKQMITRQQKHTILNGQFPSTLVGGVYDVTKPTDVIQVCPSPSHSLQSRALISGQFISHRGGRWGVGVGGGGKGVEHKCGFVCVCVCV